MRKQLKKLNGQRFRVTATFNRFGTKDGFRGPEKTVLLTDIKKDGALITDHLWFACGKTFESLELTAGDIIAFDARVTAYEKGYRGRRAEAWTEVDYRLERPTKARKIEPHQPMG